MTFFQNSLTQSFQQSMQADVNLWCNYHPDAKTMIKDHGDLFLPNDLCLNSVADLSPSEYHVTLQQKQVGLGSMGQKVDGAVALFNQSVGEMIGVEVDRPLGAQREALVNTLTGAEIFGSLFFIGYMMSGLILRPGRDGFQATRNFMLFLFGAFFTQRVFTDLTNDYLPDHKIDSFVNSINWQVFLAFWETWDLTVVLGAMAAVLVFPLSENLLKIFQSRYIKNDHYIYSGDSVLEATPENIKAFGSRFSFQANAEHLSQEKLASDYEKLALQHAKTTFRVDGQNYEMIRSYLAKLSGQGVNVSARMKTIEKVKNKTLLPGAGKLLAGARLVDGGKKRLLQESFVVTHPVEVVEGRLEVEQELDLGKKVPWYALSQKYSEVEIVVEGKVEEYLFDLAKAVGERRLYSSVGLLPKSFRKGVRKISSRYTPFDVEMSFVEELDENVLSSLARVSGEKRRVAKLSQSLRLPFSRPVAEFLTNKNDVDFFHFAVHEKFASRLKVAGLISPGFRVGKWVYFALPKERVLSLAKDKDSVLNQMARQKISLIHPDSALVLLVSSEHKPIQNYWEITDVENLAMKTPAGSSEPYFSDGLMTQTRWQSFAEGARVLAEGGMRSFRFGRASSMMTRTAVASVLGGMLVVGCKVAMGFSWEVAVLSSSRVPVSETIAASAAPGMMNSVGVEKYSILKYITPAMTFAALFEAFNEIPEANLPLYRQKVEKLQGEDRPEKRLEMAKQLQKLEAETYVMWPELRKEILKTRLANVVPTGVVTVEDAKLLKEIYEEGQGTQENFEAEFLTSMLLDDGFVKVVKQDEKIHEFFQQEISSHQDQIQKVSLQYGVEVTSF